MADDAVSNRSDDTALEEPTRLVAALETVRRTRADSDVEANQPEAMLGGSKQESAAAQSHEAEDADEVADERLMNEAEDEPVETRRGSQASAQAPPVEICGRDAEEIRMDWYILKVQSNRERSIAEALERKMRIEGLDRFFDQVIVPTEKVTEFKGGKKKIVERKLYPGYIVVHMHINDDTWFAVRETSGVGDFTGAGGKPTPMLAQRSGAHRSDRGRRNQRSAEARHQVQLRATR